MATQADPGRHFFLRFGAYRTYFFAIAPPPETTGAATFGAVAQLGERYNGIVEVVGSIPSGSTKFRL